MLKIDANQFQERMEARWENGEDQADEARELVRLLHRLDLNCTNMFELGGDGDPGETLVDMLSELVDLGIVSLKVDSKVEVMD